MTPARRTTPHRTWPDARGSWGVLRFGRCGSAATAGRHGAARVGRGCSLQRVPHAWVCSTGTTGAGTSAAQGHVQVCYGDDRHPLGNVTFGWWSAEPSSARSAGDRSRLRKPWPGTGDRMWHGRRSRRTCSVPRARIGRASAHRAGWNAPNGVSNGGNVRRNGFLRRCEDTGRLDPSEKPPSWG